MLTDAERRVLAVYCFDHVVATCENCHRDFKLIETGVDVVARPRSRFCPRCRFDLTDSIRVHVLTCTAITAALDERSEAGQQRIKESQRLRAESERLAAESQERSQRVLRRRNPDP